MAQRFRQAWSGIGYTAKQEETRENFLEWVRGQCTALGGLSLLAAFAVSQAVLPLGATALSVPFVAALAMLGKPALPAVLGGALGLLARWQPITLASGWPLMACVLLLCIVRSEWNWKPWKVALAAAACMALPLPLAVRHPDTLAAFLSGTIAAGVLTPVFARALLALNLPDQALSSDDKLCLLLLCASVSMGLEWVRVRGCSLGGMLAALCVLAAGYCAGPGLAAAAGVLLGLLQAFSGGQPLGMLYLCALGALAGLPGSGARWLCAAGAGLGVSALVLLASGLEGVALQLPPILLAALVFAVLPQTWLDALRGLLQPQARFLSGGACAAMTYVLRERARALSDMTRLLPAQAAEEEMPPVELLACRLCTGCERQRECWDARREESLRLMDGALTACAGREGRGAEEAVRRAVQAFGCLRGAEMYPLAAALVGQNAQQEQDRARLNENRAWIAEQLDAQARTLFSVCEQIEGEDGTALRAREAVCTAMPALRGRPDALSICVLDGRLHIWLNVACESETKTARLETALGAAVGAKMECLRRGEEWMLFSEKPALRVVVGRACATAAGEQVSGDGSAWERLSAGKYLLAVSDGMGSGREANRESRAALELLLRALRAGYSRRDALRLVNGMLEACRGGETFATMDLCVAELDSGEVNFEKLSACPSYLLRGGRCRRIGGDALPLGIVGAATPRRLSARLQPGDLLLMVTDGVVDAFGRDDAAFLRALGGMAPRDGEADPQQVADTLLQRALQRVKNTPPDDMTVLAARVESNE